MLSLRLHSWSGLRVNQQWAGSLGRAVPPAASRTVPTYKRAHPPARRMTTQATGMEGFESKLAELPAEGAYILFKADWCPDCVRSTQAVRDAVAAAGGRLLEVDVAAQPFAWKTPAHPLRSDARFSLSGIPTLVYWKGGAVAAKLGSDLERAPSTAAAAKVVADFVKRMA